MPNNDYSLFYLRAMSVEEYTMWAEERNGCEIMAEREWIRHEERGYGLKFFKEKWVDQSYRRRCGDVHAIIVGVRAANENEFIEEPMIAPVRYLNTNPISLERVVIVYDPRASILTTPRDLDLEDPTQLLRK